MFKDRLLRRMFEPNRVKWDETEEKYIIMRHRIVFLT
jgi:hypothetical protein